MFSRTFISETRELLETSRKICYDSKMFRFDVTVERNQLLGFFALGKIHAHTHLIDRKRMRIYEEKGILFG